MASQRRWALRVVAVLALLIYAVAFQGARPLWEPDEGRYTAVAIEMLRSGDWWTPHLNPEVPHFTKPPLTYWAIAGSLAAFGRNELAARLPNAIAFVLTVLLIWAIARRLELERPWLAGLVYATSLLPWAAVNTVTTDTLLTLWLALAAFGAAGAWTAPENGRRKWFVLMMWLGLGLGFLTKGPVSLLPLGGFALFAVLTGGRSAVRRLVTLPGLAVFAVVAFSWFVVEVATKPELLGYFLGYEVVDRVISGTHGRHGQWYGAVMVYLPTLVVGAMPWLIVAAHDWRSVGALFRRGAWARWRVSDRPLVFLLLWFVVPLGVLCVARSRLPLYLLPSFVPLALLLSRALARRVRATPLTVAALAVWIVALISMRVGAAHVAPDKSTAEVAAALEATVDGPIDKVVFVGAYAGYGYGFAFYLDCEVEHVALHEAGISAASDRVRDLAQELAEAPENRVLVVPEHAVEGFDRVIGECGATVEPVGEWNDMRLYWSPKLGSSVGAARGPDQEPPRRSPGHRELSAVGLAGGASTHEI